MDDADAKMIEALTDALDHIDYYNRNPQLRQHKEILYQLLLDLGGSYAGQI